MKRATNKYQINKYLCAFLLTLLCISAKSQTLIQEADSVWQATNSKPKDTLQLKSLNDILNALSEEFPDTAIFYAQSNLKKCEAANYHKGIVQATIKLATCYQFKQQFDKAVDFYLKALALAQQYKLAYDEIDACNNLGIYYAKQGYIEFSLEYHLKGLRIAEATNDSGAIATLFNNIGLRFSKLNQYDKAMGYYKKALDLNRIRGKEGKMVPNLKNMAASFLATGQTDSALIYYNKALVIDKKRGVVFYRSEVYTGLANCYLALNNLDKATECKDSALNIYRKFEDSAGMFDGLLIEAMINLKKNNNATSIANLESLAQYAEKYGYRDKLNNIYDTIANYYSNKGNFTKAYQYLKKETVLKDSFFENDKERANNQLALYLQAKNDNEKNTLSRTLQLETKEKERQRTITILFVILGIVLSGIVLTLGIFYRRLQKQKTLITGQANRLKWMMKELHHRVKNNLQIVSSLLNLQSYRQQDASSQTALKESRLRVQAMSLIHQRLYQGNEISEVNFKLYITDLIETLMNAYGYNADDFDLRIDITKEMLDVDTVLPLGLMANEIITDAFKYAYQNVQQPFLQVSLHQDNTNIIVDITDNGPGVPIVNNNYQSEGFGKSLIEAFTQQLHGTCTISVNKGLHYQFIFPYIKENAA